MILPTLYFANLCRTQQLIHFRVFRLGSAYGWIESFNDQPDCQNHFLQKNGERQGNVAGNTVTAKQGQHASRHHQDDRDDAEAREPSGNEPGLEEKVVVHKCTQAEGEYRHQRSVVAYAHQQITDSLKRRTIGSSRCCELLAECQKRQQAHEADHVKGRLNGSEDDRTKG